MVGHGHRGERGHGNEGAKFYSPIHRACSTASTLPASSQGQQNHPSQMPHLCCHTSIWHLPVPVSAQHHPCSSQHLTACPQGWLKLLYLTSNWPNPPQALGSAAPLLPATCTAGHVACGLPRRSSSRLMRPRSKCSEAPVPAALGMPRCSQLTRPSSRLLY